MAMLLTCFLVLITGLQCFDIAGASMTQDPDTATFTLVGKVGNRKFWKYNALKRIEGRWNADEVCRSSGLSLISIDNQEVNDFCITHLVDDDWFWTSGQVNEVPSSFIWDKKGVVQVFDSTDFGSDWGVCGCLFFSGYQGTGSLLIQDCEISATLICESEEDPAQLPSN